MRRLIAGSVVTRRYPAVWRILITALILVASTIIGLLSLPRDGAVQARGNIAAMRIALTPSGDIARARVAWIWFKPSSDGGTKFVVYAEDVEAIDVTLTVPAETWGGRYECGPGLTCGPAIAGATFADGTTVRSRHGRADALYRTDTPRGDTVTTRMQKEIHGERS
jgi:hypothetical protein